MTVRSGLCSMILIAAAIAASCSSAKSGTPSTGGAGPVTPPGGGTGATQIAGGAATGNPAGTSQPGAGTGLPATGGAGMGMAPAPGTGGVMNPAAGAGGAGAPAAMPGAMPGSGGATGMGSTPPMLGPGQTLPAVTDYGAPGPFQTTTMDGTGPDGMYTIYRPTTLGDNGFKHPIATWGNGITTTPQLYPGLLGGIASHGFVIVASDSSNVTAQLMTAGLDWLIKQNDAGGMFADKLDVKRAASIGYSLGGGAAVTAGNHPNVIVTVSMHGLPGMAAGLHGPLLLFTSVMDTFVTYSGFVDPNFKASTVQTFYATLVGAGDAGHLTPVGDAGPERAPMIAWLRLWVYGDTGAKKYFYDPDCILCKAPWGPPQDTTLMYRKNWQ